MLGFKSKDKLSRKRFFIPVYCLSNVTFQVLVKIKIVLLPILKINSLFVSFFNPDYTEFKGEKIQDYQSLSFTCLHKNESLYLIRFSDLFF